MYITLGLIHVNTLSEFTLNLFFNKKDYSYYE